MEMVYFCVYTIIYYDTFLPYVTMSEEKIRLIGTGIYSSQKGNGV